MQNNKKININIQGDFFLYFYVCKYVIGAYIYTKDKDTVAG